jgi:polyphosphate kinase 2 (PPK2 family)
MLEKVDLTKKLRRADYEARLPGLQRRLRALQGACTDHKVTSLIVFEGWDGAGTEGAIHALTNGLDPRRFRLYTIQGARGAEEDYPWLWRFWRRTPAYGEMAIFDRSWYRRVLIERVEGLASEMAWRKAYRDINDFEQSLAEDGVVIVKFWFHLSKGEQKRRVKKHKQESAESRLMHPDGWKHHKKYNEYLVAVEEMLERTDSDWARWTLVPATSRWYARNLVHETVAARLGACLGDNQPALEGADDAPQADDSIADDIRKAMEAAESIL